MIPLPIDRIARAVAARVNGRAVDEPIQRVVTDSREVRPGDLFVAVRGERFDGHDFVDQALEAGASACLVSETADVQHPPSRSCLLEVGETVPALGKLAAWYRREVMSQNTCVVAITGSNGKTTTKQMLDHVLSVAWVGQASPRSFNNELGVPLTLLSSNEGDRYLIVEVGTNAPGEIAALSALVEPNVAVVTSIGEAHLEGLGDLSAVAKEKASLLRFVRPGGLAVVNTDRAEIGPFLSVGERVTLKTMGHEPGADVVTRAVASSLAGTTVELDGRDVYEVPLPGTHHAMNLAAVVTVARWLGMDKAQIRDRLRSFAPASGRAAVTRLGPTTIVDDAYNANPTSMTAAVHTLAEATAMRRVMIFGDMFELGAHCDALHERLIDCACREGIDVIVAVGPAFTRALARRAGGPCPPRVSFFCFEDAALAAAAMPALTREGDCIWVKGSRAVGLERVVARLQRVLVPQAAVA